MGGGGTVEYGERCMSGAGVCVRCGGGVGGVRSVGVCVCGRGVCQECWCV